MRLGLSSVPNAVTLVRVAAIPFVINAMAARDDVSLAVWIAVVALSDFLDGFLARRLHAQSDGGKLLDPTADKICTFFLVVALWRHCAFPGWALALILGKDLFVAVGALLLARKARVPITPNFWGKATLATELFAFVAYAFRLGWLKPDSLVVMTFFIAVSTLIYAGVFLAVIRGRKTVPEIVAGYSAYGLSRSGAARARWTNALIYLLCAGLMARLAWLIFQQALP